MTPAVAAVVERTIGALGLAPRLAAVLRLAVDGQDPKAIASKLKIEHASVAHYSKLICRRARARSLARLVIALLRAALEVADRHDPLKAVAEGLDDEPRHPPRNHPVPPPAPSGSGTQLSAAPCASPSGMRPATPRSTTEHDAQAQSSPAPPRAAALAIAPDRSSSERPQRYGRPFPWALRPPVPPPLPAEPKKPHARRRAHA